jgi:hypothetical protein
MNIKSKSVKNLIFLTVGILAIMVSCDKTQESKAPFKPLFDGKSLDGWHIIGGTASYEVKEGTIVGTSALNTKNTFLCTDQNYGDFILEFDYKVDPKLNSGVQIRSNSIPEYRDGVVHGYQIEIDPSERAWSAGIYEEQDRGWLYNLKDNPEAQKAFKQNGWNRYRIEAIGDTLKTWINGVEAAHLIDDRTATGFIGLQVHGIGKDEEKNGTQVVWKNINILTEDLGNHSKPMTLPAKYTLNQLTDVEAKDGWEMLWDGKSYTGWRGAKLQEFPETGWEIENGVLSVLASDGGESTGGGDIVTKELYANFELKLDFRITEGANSGIKYYVNTDLNKGEGSSIGLEYQILDDLRHPDAKLGNHEGSRTLASLYDLIQADQNKRVKPIGDWNQARILSQNKHVEHWLNGVKVLEYERGGDDYRKLVKESKYVDWPNFGEAEKGNILLQDHGNLVSFRNIKIREINVE